MTRDFNDSDIEDEIREAFRMFDKASLNNVNDLL